MHIDPTTTKYLIKAKISAEGIVEKPDVVGAIFGQTEGLLGDELDLRDLQKGGRIGRIEVEIDSKHGRSDGEVLIPSSLDQIETAILAASLETIERVGPCKAKIDIVKIEDIRASKRNKIIDKAKALLAALIEETRASGVDLTETIRSSVQIEEITTYGPDKCPAGPNIDSSDSIIVVEGRADVLNLLRAGIKNAIAVEGTSVTKTIQNLSRDKITTAFVDGDRGGELILKELLQTTELDFVTIAPKDKEVEELGQKQIIKCLRNKMPVDQFVEMYGLKIEKVALGIPQPVTGSASSPAASQQSPVHQSALPPPQPQPPPFHMPEDRRKFFTILKPKREEAKKTLSPAQQKYRELLYKLANTSRAHIVDGQGNTISELLVRDLPEAVKVVPEGASILVFDGIITQRLIDVLSDTAINTIVGVKVGNVTKLPTSMTILTRDDLG